MKTLLLTLVLILTSMLLIAQDYQTEFQKCIEINDTTCQVKVLLNWEEDSPDNPELFTSYFNYYFLKAKRDVITLSKDQSNGGSYELRDSSNMVAGFLGSQVYYDQKDIENGLNWINTGLEKFPNRLDMIFGKIYVLGEVNDWIGFTKEIIRVVNYSSKNKNKWIWTNNEEIEDGKEFLLSSIQDYQVQLYNTDDDSLLLNMRQVATAILNHYPNHIQSLSNLSITHLLLGETDEGIQPLLKAEKIDPEDYIVLSNIAHGYKLKGDYKKAIEYYEKTVKYGNDQAVKFAEQQIQDLKTKSN